MDWLDLSVENVKNISKNRSYYYMNNLNELDISSLYNLGQTCYLNAITECLVYTPPLAKYILTGEYYDKADLLLMEFTKLAKMMYSDQYKLQPKGWYKAFLRSFKEPAYQQEDAHEVLLHILDVFHERLRRPMAIYKDKNEDSLIKKSLIDLKKIPMSPINEIFMGQLHQRTQCTNCRHLNHSFPTFKNLQFPLGQSGKSNLRIPKYRMLNHLMAEYCHKERIIINCDSCGAKNVTAHKKITMWKLPQVLIITLGRFNPDATKNNIHVDFDLEGFDLTKFSTYPIVYKQVYNLYATINHTGTLDYGHYTSRIKYQGYWLHINDEKISRIEPDDVVTAETYILFYKRNENF